MQINWKILTPLVAVIIAGGWWTMTGNGQKNTTSVPSAAVSPVPTELVKDGSTNSVPEPVTNPSTVPAPVAVSGNVDELAQSLTTSADADLVSLSNPADDQALVVSDSATLTGLTTAYDETTF